MSLLPLRTARLTLRVMRPPDAPALAAYRDDRGVARFQDWELPYTLEDAERLIAGQAHLGDVTPGEWLQVAIDRGGEMIGDLAVGWLADGRVPLLGYTLAPSEQGRGYASEAAAAMVDGLFAGFGVHRIVATLDPQNFASMRVIEPLGFRLEGVARQAELVRGEWLDDMRFGLLGDDRRSWLDRPTTPPATVELIEVTEHNLSEVTALATFEYQRRFVAPMAGNLAEALVPPTYDDDRVVPWFRAIAADGQIAGFLMLAMPTEHEPNPYLWRLLIDRVHQRRGIGEMAVARLVEQLRAEGHRALLLSYVEAPGGPKPFYDRLGFRPTGDVLDGETVARLELVS